MELFAPSWEVAAPLEDFQPNWWELPLTQGRVRCPGGRAETGTVTDKRSGNRDLDTQLRALQLAKKSALPPPLPG